MPALLAFVLAAACKFAGCFAFSTVIISMLLSCYFTPGRRA